MKIGIDARFYGPRVGGGGLGRYVAELVTHLQQIDKVNDYVLFLRKENFHECVITNGKFTKRMVDVPWYSLAEQRVIPQEVAQSRAHVMHFPHWNVPLMLRKPFVVTIHDLILLDDPMSARATTRGAFVHAVKYAGFRLAIDNAVHRSKHIIAVSEYTRRRILERFRVSPHKVTAIHNGIMKPLAVDPQRLQALGIHTPYVLYVGNAYPHKNLGLLLAAFHMAFVRHPELRLVLAGRRDAFVEQLEAEAKSAGFPPGTVTFINAPSDEDIAALYAGTSLFVYPSRLEGFGMPPLEAMTYGAPVAVSRAASLPEVCAHAARYFDPDNATELAGLILDAVDRPESYAESQRAGIRRPTDFSWRTTAEQTLNTYLTAGIRRL
ncbi:MAG: glycosyl transferase, group 1 [Candidatus Uhrbacteria bacterium GW2011_GWD2_52_7]|uniref:Glycosyl transferase, group 1 n=1 Tax=Candidatus Uhrbacteria bacterium GW2011_GWD2_52_7 TaxID=1618989 RepID=A0A0G1ZR45_9BACT|nr:MAG: glycosyl transferase, group 1 [Candidatus Uhrbacteria bacterium GW2011_GWD2_52_7]